MKNPTPIPMTNSIPEYRRVAFDLNGTNAELYDGRLELDVKALNLPGPLFSAEIREALEDAGLSARDIDLAGDDLYDEFQTKLLAKWLTKRRR